MSNKVATTPTGPIIEHEVSGQKWARFIAWEQRWGKRPPPATETPHMLGGLGMGIGIVATLLTLQWVTWTTIYYFYWISGVLMAISITWCLVAYARHYFRGEPQYRYEE